MKMANQHLLHRLFVFFTGLLGTLLLANLAGIVIYDYTVSAGGPSLNEKLGFSFNCDNTAKKPCRKLIAKHEGRPVTIEPSSAAWSEQYKKVIVVSDNYNDLVEHNAGHYVIVSFGLEEGRAEIPVEPLLTPEQIQTFPLYDLEGVTLDGDRLYAIGSLALHGKDPRRDRWERHQFVQMNLREDQGRLKTTDLSHIAKRWPNFRDWLISKSGYAWTAEETRGRAEAEGINVEALSATSTGTLIVGFRGPLSSEGGTLALEIQLPTSTDEEPSLIKRHVLPSVNIPHIPKGAAKTLRGMVEAPGESGEFYVLLGPKGYEKEEIVLAHWDINTGQLSKVTRLPEGFVAEGVAPIAPGQLLIVDDLKEMILIATEN